MTFRSDPETRLLGAALHYPLLVGLTKSYADELTLLNSLCCLEGTPDLSYENHKDHRVLWLCNKSDPLASSDGTWSSAVGSP